VEQNLHFAAGLADRHYVIEGGRVVDCFDSGRMAAEGERVKAYLGL
jgi:branched-chain amino acid transport system ATP-binding protein